VPYCYEKDSLEQPNTNPGDTDIQNDVLDMLHETQPIGGFSLFNNGIAIYNEEPKVDVLDGITPTATLS
jgi:hypothetical protein